MATAITCLPSVELDPGRPATHSVVWLHGLGADGFDFPPLVPHLGLGGPADLGDEGLAVRFVFPHAPRIPVTINGGAVMPAWYDLRDGDLTERHDVEGVRRSAAELARLVQREGQRGVPPERVVVAGFSQGGAVAVHLALRHDQRLAGLVMLSSYLATDEGLEQERSEANLGLPIFQAHGTRDPMVPLERGRGARERLTGLGYSIDWFEYPMEHQASLEEARELGRWLRARFGDRDAR